MFKYLSLGFGTYDASLSSVGGDLISCRMGFGYLSLKIGWMKILEMYLSLERWRDLKGSVLRAFNFCIFSSA